MLDTNKALEIGRILLREGLLTKEKLDESIDEAQEKGHFLERVLIRNKLLTERQIVEAISHHLDIPGFFTATHSLDPDVIGLIPEEDAIKYMALPVSRIKDRLVVAMPDPRDILILDQISRATGYKYEIEPVVGGRLDILMTLYRYYNRMEEIREHVGDMKQTPSSSSQILMADSDDESDIDLEKLGREAPIIELCNNIILDAVLNRASDIHLEPYKRYTRVRFRIDGRLKDYRKLPQWTQKAIISRLKIMGNMDISQKRIPQDGRADVRVKDREVDLRISSLPVKFGEKIVIRLLEKTGQLLELSRMGFSPERLAVFEEMLKHSFGIIILTGPTGSGKTTTLYAALLKIKDPTKNILTVEDPIEYDLEDICQSQVNEKAGLTFAEQLRCILRQDPDVIMLGEMRDLESAEMAFRASLTGHLVFSTLHTNDAPSAVSRLQDMGVEPYLIASSVIGIVAQRLVRVLCPKCKEAYRPDPGELTFLDMKDLPEILYRAKGCPECDFMGYHGRIAIYELLRSNDEIKRLILARAPANEIRKAAKANGMISLQDDLHQKMIEGVTSLDEVARIGLLEMM